MNANKSPPSTIHFARVRPSKRGSENEPPRKTQTFGSGQVSLPIRAAPKRVFNLNWEACKIPKADREREDDVCEPCPAPCPVTPPSTFCSESRREFHSPTELDGESASCIPGRDVIEDVSSLDGRLSPAESTPSPVVMVPKSLFEGRRKSRQTPRADQHIATSPTKLADRFITPRKLVPGFKDRLVLGTPPEKLTSREKVMRRRTGLSDPFNGNTRNRQRPVEDRQLTQSASPMQPSRVRVGTEEALPSQSDIPVSPQRRFSTGAVWNVGGWAAANPLDFESQPSLQLSSGPGNNAPRYTSRFLEEMASNADQETYEKRLALAFDLDLTQRVLCHNSKTLKCGMMGFGGPCRDLLAEATKWKDNEWTRHDPITRMLLHIAEYLQFADFAHCIGSKSECKERKTISKVAFRYVSLILS